MKILKRLGTMASLTVTAMLCAPTAGHALSILGSSETFGVLAGSTVTNTGATQITGNLGVNPGSSIIGFPPGLVSGGTIHGPDGVSLQAQNDLRDAWVGLAALAPTRDLTGQDLGGLTLISGIYHFDSSAQLTGALTLDAQGNDRAFWVFQIGSTLMTATNSSVQVVNSGANDGRDDGLFWEVGSSATLGTGTAFKGNVLALTSITMTTGATDECGRMLARNGAVTLDNNVISNVCPNGGPGMSGGLYYDKSGKIVPVPEPATWILFGTALAGLAFFRKGHSGTA